MEKCNGTWNMITVLPYSWYSTLPTMHLFSSDVIHDESLHWKGILQTKQHVIKDYLMELPALLLTKSWPKISSDGDENIGQQLRKGDHDQLIKLKHPDVCTKHYSVVMKEIFGTKSLVHLADWYSMI